MPITKDELHERLVSKGASPGTPKSWGLINGMVLDAEVCEQATCESCSYKGLELVTIWTTLKIYRAAVAVCSQCNEAFEGALSQLGLSPIEQALANWRQAAEAFQQEAQAVYDDA